MVENNNLLVKLDNCGVYKSSKWIVRGISLEIHKGKIVTLIGFIFYNLSKNTGYNFF